MDHHRLTLATVRRWRRPGRRIQRTAGYAPAHNAAPARGRLSAVLPSIGALEQEMAAGIAFFLSEEAGFITGQTLFIDGGASIGRLSV